MERSPQLEVAERVNAARMLLKKSSSGEAVVADMVARFGVSRRQAYRYVKEAQKKKRKEPIPERKVVFTVKLHESLVTLIRRVADSTGESLSSLVSQALKAFLRRRGYGRKAS